MTNFMVVFFALDLLFHKKVINIVLRLSKYPDESHI